MDQRKNPFSPIPITAANFTTWVFLGGFLESILHQCRKTISTHNFSGADLCSKLIILYILDLGLWDLNYKEIPILVVLNTISDLQLKVNLVMTDMLKCSRQCSSSSFNVVQGCVAVVYLSCTMLWHGLGRDTSHNQTLPLWVKIAQLHCLENLIVNLKVIKTVEPNCCRFYTKKTKPKASSPP